jgi:hypothetical protein
VARCFGRCSHHGGGGDYHDRGYRSRDDGSDDRGSDNRGSHGCSGCWIGRPVPLGSRRRRRRWRWVTHAKYALLVVHLLAAERRVQPAFLGDEEADRDAPVAALLPAFLHEDALNRAVDHLLGARRRVQRARAVAVEHVRVP